MNNAIIVNGQTIAVSATQAQDFLVQLASLGVQASAAPSRYGNNIEATPTTQTHTQATANIKQFATLKGRNWYAKSNNPWGLTAGTRVSKEGKPYGRRANNHG